jgi:hypothetical protein
MAISGEEASFLAGGEIPIPVPQPGSGGTTITIEYKEFGIRLAFLPLVMGDGRIRLKVAPEVSELDYSHAVSISGTEVPGLTERKLQTAVELNEGQTLALAGLLDNSVTSSKNVTPILGDLPILFFLMSQVLDPNLLMEAMHLGIKEFIPLPDERGEVHRRHRARGPGSWDGQAAKIIHVIPTIGGCGSTTVACNVAASLAKTGKTVLVDLDLIRGGVASYFDTRPRYTIADVMDAAEKLDKQLLDNALAIHQERLAILARPDCPKTRSASISRDVHRLLACWAGCSITS